MNMGPNEEPRSEVLAAYLEGEVTASEAAAIEAALAESPGARRRLEQLRRIQATLGSPVSELESIDLAPIVRSAARSAPKKRGLRFASRWHGVAAIAACSAALVVGVIGTRPADEEFRAKSVSSSGPEQDRWAGVQVYRVRGGAPQTLGARMTNQEGLLFSYTNLGPRPFEFLMIFAVDSKGEVRWFHPAYESAGTNPSSIPIQEGQTNTVLPEVIRHDFAPGKVTVYALFTHRARSVLDVEALLARHSGDPTGLLTPEASLQTLTTWVEP